MPRIMAIQQASSRSAHISSTGQEEQGHHHMFTKCPCQISIAVSIRKMIHMLVRSMRDMLSKPSWRCRIIGVTWQHSSVKHYWDAAGKLYFLHIICKKRIDIYETRAECVSPPKYRVALGVFVRPSWDSKRRAESLILWRSARQLDM